MKVRRIYIRFHHDDLRSNYFGPSYQQRDSHYNSLKKKSTFTWVQSYSMDFKAPGELWNPLIGAVPGKLHGSGRHSECKCLQDWANFYRSLSWQIVLIFSCDKAALRTLLSVCASLCPSAVCPSVTPFSLCSHHRIIMKFSGVITNAKSDVHAKSQGQRSKVKVTEAKTQLSRFWTVTPVWIHIWQWNNAQSLIMLRRGALLFLKVIRQIPRSHGTQNRWFWPKFGVSNCNSSLNWPMAMKWCTKL